VGHREVLFLVDVASPFILISLCAALIQIIPLPLQKRTVKPRNLQKDSDAQARNDDLQTSLTLQQASINICVFYIKVLQMSKIPRSSLLLSVHCSSGLISHVNCAGICKGGFSTHRPRSAQPGRHLHVGEEHPELQPQAQLMFRSCTQRPPPLNAEDSILVHYMGAPSPGVVSRCRRSVALGKAGCQGSPCKTRGGCRGAPMQHTACAPSSSSTSDQRRAEEPSPVPSLVKRCGGRGAGASTPALVVPSPLEAADTSQQVDVFNSWGNIGAR